jgi:electron transport complex protein RnfC|tara:strand:- start:143 stop:1492 length:1350 start_codon:yes stop_codon:yes gene_type:complete
LAGLIHRAWRNSFPHGIHPPGNKFTNRLPIKRLPFADELIIPLSQHIGAPAEPIVHRGQEVVRGEPIAKASGFVSVPMHSPVTGVIAGIELTPTAKGPKTKSIIVRPHPGAGQKVLYGAPQDYSRLDRNELITAVQDTGIVGLGGAAFPLHVKLAAPPGTIIDTVIANGCECEPFLTADHRLMIEHADEIISGIQLVMKLSGAKQAIIGLENNKGDAFHAIKMRLPDKSPISARLLETKYPQGSEKMLITTLTGREVPSGGFPYQIGVIVHNVATLAQLGTLMPLRRGLIERVVTVTGPGVKKPGNYLTPLGTPIRQLLDYVGFSGTANHLILGGPMMGSSVASLDVPVTKAVGGIIVLAEERKIDEHPKNADPCIKCGRCLQACPLKLNPSQLGLLAAKREYQAMEEEFHLNDCFECGCCSYVCPSSIPLVQYFRIAKAINREQLITA